MLTLLALGLLIAEPYRPFPVIFVHGINSNAGTWGLLSPRRLKVSPPVHTLSPSMPGNGEALWAANP